jgi:hypothetical protein
MAPKTAAAAAAMMITIMICVRRDSCVTGRMEGGKLPLESLGGTVRHSC